MATRKLTDNMCRSQMHAMNVLWIVFISYVLSGMANAAAIPLDAGKDMHADIKQIAYGIQNTRLLFERGFNVVWQKAGLPAMEFANSDIVANRNVYAAWRIRTDKGKVIGDWKATYLTSEYTQVNQSLLDHYTGYCNGVLDIYSNKSIERGAYQVQYQLASCTKADKLIYASIITISSNGYTSLILHETNELPELINSINERLPSALLDAYTAKQ